MFGRKKKKINYEEIKRRMCDEYCRHIRMAADLAKGQTDNEELTQAIFDKLDMLCMTCPLNELPR